MSADAVYESFCDEGGCARPCWHIHSMTSTLGMSKQPMTVSIHPTLTPPSSCTGVATVAGAGLGSFMLLHGVPALSAIYIRVLTGFGVAPGPVGAFQITAQYDETHDCRLDVKR